MEKVTAGNSEIWADGDILMVKMSGVVTAEDIEAMSRAGRDVAGRHGTKYGIVDITDVKDAPFGLRKADPGCFTGPVRKAALVCASNTSRMVGYFLLKRYDIPVPTKIFSDMEGAKKWISGK